MAGERIRSKWLAPFFADLTHPAQRRMCPTCIAGLTGPGDRKSIQPLAARTEDAGYDQLHHVIASGTWDPAPLERRLLAEANRRVGDAQGFPVIDDTALPKKGRASAGVAPQYASSQGKTSNCRSLVSVTLASREVPVMVGLSSCQTVCPADVEPTFPTARGGRPRKYHIPDRAAVSVADMLAGEPWRKVTWRRGTRGRLTCLFAARRVRIAEGHRHRMAGNRVRSMPGDEVWLVGERRSGGEHRYYVSNLPPDTSLPQLVAAIKARWVCEQAHQQLKEELGPDHFERRSWPGLHRHAVMTMLACAFLQSRRLKPAGRKTKSRWTAPATDPASHPANDPRPPGTTTADTLPPPS